MAFRAPIYAVAGAAAGYLAFHVNPLLGPIPLLVLLLLERAASSRVSQPGQD